jgi:hypothetical protein
VLKGLSCFGLSIVTLGQSTIRPCISVLVWPCDQDRYVFLQVMHPFEAEDAGELSLSVGDYVVVRQVQ